jgi:hypothetical protein
MTEALPPPSIEPAAVDGAGLVVADLPCRKCSYNLKAMSVTGRCPECGAPVGVAVHGDLLRYSDPQWLRDLSKGAGLAFWGVFIAAAVSVAGGVIAQMTVPLISPIATIAGGLVYLYGAWLLTQPDPSGLGEDRYGRSRQIIRVALLVGLLDGVVDGLHVSTAPPPAFRIALGVISVAAGLVGVVGQFATLRYLERLTLRIPDSGLSKNARVVFWGYGLSLAVMVFTGGLAAGMGYAGASSGAPPAGGLLGVIVAAGCVAAIAVLAALGFGIVFLVLLYRLKRAFAQQAAASESIWAGGSPPAAQQVLASPAP